MRFLLKIIIALFLAVGAALLLRHDPGFVFISWGGFWGKTSLAAFVVLLTVAGVILVTTLHYTFKLLRLPRTMREANQRRQERKARKLLTRGMSNLIEGDWQAAELLLSRDQPHSDAPVLHYLGAARAAHRLGSAERRDHYLGLAAQMPGKTNELLVAINRAEFLLEDGKADKAKVALEAVRPSNPNHPHVLALLSRCYETLHEWTALDGVLLQARKRNALPSAELDRLALASQLGHLALAAHRGLPSTMQAQWKQIPREIKLNPEVLIAYVTHLREMNAADEAASVLQDALRQQWNSLFVVAYGELGRGNVLGQLSTAEGWLKEHPDDPALLLTLGRLARRAEKLPQAREYLQRCIKLAPQNADAYQELGEVLEELKDAEGARQCYRTGMRLLSGRQEALQATEVIPATSA